MTVYLAEDNERWGKHSGEAGHSGTEWGPADLQRAAVFLGELSPQAMQVFEYLLRNPGREIHCTELVDEALCGADGVDPARRVAGVLSGMSRAHDNSERRYPFVWWEAPQGRAGATYAVRPSVAAVFLAARLGR
ncbi:DUF6416 domain-containing protein [Streptomyces sp. MB09-02B]|uniref:DUF6416 domain-containing protein n=1 Tax=Streptomyces sp. MB09-02B TaxID=3028667 RepID=UPI0029B9677D|nr:DUF6416 domain-containing protein [Streptomyces sp. MB09-02B]MDX3641809.1 DUF6416 domain-containing protein [Streptomyces sp. MB09-02B]